MLATSSHIDFRGAYAEFDLVIVGEKGSHVMRATSGGVECSCFERHMRGNDGLWVIETSTTQKAAWLAAGVRRAGFKIEYRSASGLSFVATGAERLPNVEGLDGCGENPDTSVIPVPAHAVPLDLLGTGPAFAPPSTCADAQPPVQAVVDAISQDELLGRVGELQAFGTRNSYSQPVHDAADYLKARAAALGLAVSEFPFRSDMAPNVVAELKGATDEVVIVGAHFDSRSTDSSSPTMAAPGADDNASGSAALLELMRVLSGTPLQV